MFPRTPDTPATVLPAPGLRSGPISSNSASLKPQVGRFYTAVLPIHGRFTVDLVRVEQHICLTVVRLTHILRAKIERRGDIMQTSSQSGTPLRRRSVSPAARRPEHLDAAAGATPDPRPAAASVPPVPAKAGIAPLPIARPRVSVPGRAAPPIPAEATAGAGNPSPAPALVCDLCAPAAHGRGARTYVVRCSACGWDAVCVDALPRTRSRSRP
jgi:hypothetical protein